MILNTEWFPYLSVILFLPAAGAVVIGLLAKDARTVRLTAAVFASGHGSCRRVKNRTS